MVLKEIGQAKGSTATVTTNTYTAKKFNVETVSYRSDTVNDKPTYRIGGRSTSTYSYLEKTDAGAPSASTAQTSVPLGSTIGTAASPRAAFVIFSINISGSQQMGIVIGGNSDGTTIKHFLTTFTETTTTQYTNTSVICSSTHSSYQRRIIHMGSD